MSSELRALVAEQAKDEGLWFVAQAAPEAYLQQELRRMHAAAEGMLAALADIDPDALRKAAKEVHSLSDSPELADEVEHCADLLDVIR